jgi:hypothetical protein
VCRYVTERLVVAARRAKEEEVDRRDLINKAKRDKDALLKEKMGNINRIRNLAGPVTAVELSVCKPFCV